MNPPRIFVGTLECGEAEFDDCCTAIRSQTDVHVVHHVVSNQPEHEAHGRLWNAWTQAKDDFDLFVKVDADTVLCRRTALAEIAHLFSDPDVTGVQIQLHDYFTDQLISGLNAFSPAVAFRQASSRLFADHADFNHKRVLKGSLVAHLAPIGWHCRNPHPRQAFHFGLHRALKKQQDILGRCARAWLGNRDEPRSWALLGAMAAGWRLRKHFDYGDARFEQAFERYRGDAMREAAVEKFALSLIG